MRRRHPYIESLYRLSGSDFKIFHWTDRLTDWQIDKTDCLTPSLQKQVGCFNHRVVALVGDKLERQWSLEVCFDVED